MKRFMLVLALMMIIVSCDPTLPSPSDIGTTIPTSNTFVINPSGGDDTQLFISAVTQNSNVTISGYLRIDGIALLSNISDKIITFLPNSGLVRQSVSSLRSFQVVLLQNTKNIIINNLNILGPRSSCNYSSSIEAQHGLEISGGINITINSGNIKNMPGDGIYISKKASNINIDNVSIQCTGRSSISNTDSSKVTVNNGSFSSAGLWIFNIEPVNANDQVQSVTDYLIDHPVIGYSVSSWLFTGGPYYSCLVTNLIINKPIFSIVPVSPSIAPCVASQVVINY